MALAGHRNGSTDGLSGRPEPVEGLETPEGLVRELTRLMALASTYATGHDRVTSLAAALSLALARRSSHERPCTLLVVQDGISIDGHLVRTAGTLSHRLKLDLETIGVGEVDFYLGLVASDLILFARRVRTLASRPMDAQTSAASECLPGLSASIAARFADFGVPTTSTQNEGMALCGVPNLPVSADEAAEAVPEEPDWSGIVDRLAREVAVATEGSEDAGESSSEGADRRTDPTEPDPSSEATKAVLGDLDSETRRGDGREASVPGSRAGGVVLPDGKQARSLREMVRSVEEALRRVLDRRLGRSESRQSIAAIVRDARRVLVIAAPAAPIEAVLEHLRIALNAHLRDSFRSEVGVRCDATITGRGEAVACETTAPALVERMRDLPPETAGNAACGDPVEGLATLLWMLMDDRRPVVLDGLLRRLTARMTKPLGSAEVKAFSQWIETLVFHPNGSRRLDDNLSRIFESMRLHTPSGPASVLLGLGVKARNSSELWPYLAVEILFGMESCPAGVREQMVGAMGKVPFTALVDGKDGLVALYTRLQRRPNARFLEEPRTPLLGLYEILLDSSMARDVARHLVEGFRRKPIEGSAVCALLAPGWGEGASAFLRRVLTERRQGGESANLQYQAAQTLCTALEALPRSRRKEAWVAAAIRGLSSLKSPLAAEMVGRIQNDKRLGLVCDWPKTCRQTALSAQARANLDHRGSRDAGTRYR
jgi:hypothetical protein